MVSPHDKRGATFLICLLLVLSSAVTPWITAGFATNQQAGTDNSRASLVTQPAEQQLGTYQSFATQSANLSVTYEVGSSLATINSTVKVTATVSNTGTAPGATNVTLYADGEAVRTRNVSVAAGETETIGFTFNFSTVGTHTVRVNSAAETNVTVGNRFLDEEDVSTFNISTRLSAWERFLFPLRVDTTTAATQVENRKRVVQLSSGDVIDLQNENVGAHTAGSPVTVGFSPDRAANFNGEQIGAVPVQLMAVRLDESRELSVRTIQQLLAGDVEGSSTVVNTGTLNTSGEGQFTFEPTVSGKYVLFFATPTTAGSQFTSASTGFAVEGDMTLLGFDTLTVQRDSSRVEPQTAVDSPPTIARGKNVTFEANASSLSESRVKHLVLLYDNETFSGATEYIILDGSISVDAISNQTTIATSIARVNGKRTIRDSFNISGTNFDNRELGRTPGLGSMVDFIAESAGGRPPNAIATSETVLNGSVTAKVGGPRENLTVQTLSNFSTGTYRWMHIAEATDSTATVTNTGTLRVAEGTELNLTANRSELLVGSPVNLTVTREDTGAPVNTTIAVGNSTLRTGPDGSAIHSFETAGNITLTANPPDGLFLADRTTIEVLAPANISVVDYRLSASGVRTGETTNISATIQNTGDVTGNASIVLRIAEIQFEQSKTVSVPPQSTATVRFSVAHTEPGLYDLTLGDAETKQVAVRVGFPYRQEFATGLNNWEISANGGDGSWSGDFNGSVHLAANASSGSTMLARELGPLEVNTLIAVNYSTDEFATRDGQLQLVTRTPDGRTDLIATENGTEGPDGALLGVLPHDIPRNATVGVRLTADTEDVSTHIKGVSLRSPRGTRQIFDDFEGYPVGSTPDAWDATDEGYEYPPSRSGRKVVVDSLTPSGERAIKLEGLFRPNDNDECLRAVADHGGVNLPAEGKTVVRLRYRTSGTETGCGPPRVSFRTSPGGERRELAWLDPTTTWTSVKLVYRRHDGRIRKSYWKDGTRLQTSVTSVADFENDLKYLTLNSGTMEAFFDDVSVQSIANQEPSVGFEYTPAAPTTDPAANVTFDAAESSDADGEIRNITWRFHDGTTATGTQTTQTYTEPGTYPVTVVATDDEGAINVTTRNVTVYAPTASVNVTEFTVSDRTLTVDSPTFVNATVRNLGIENGTINVSLLQDGIHTKSKSVTVPATETVQITFETSFETTGAHTIAIDGLNETQITVTKETVAINLTAKTNTTRITDTGRLTATRPVTFTSRRSDTGSLVNTSVTISGETPLGGGTQPYNETFHLTNGRGQWTNPTSGTFSVTASRPATNTTHFRNGTLDIIVERETVPLAVRTNRTTVPDEKGVRFTVVRTDTGEPVNATLSFENHTRSTDRNGTLRRQFHQPGTINVTATKQQTAAEYYEADATTLRVLPTVSIREFDLEATSGQTLTVGFTANRSLETIEVDVRNRAGRTVTTLNEFASDPAPNGTRYRATVNVSATGVYLATLRTADTSKNQSGATGQTDSGILVTPNRSNLTATISTTSPAVDGKLTDAAWIGAANYSLRFQNAEGTGFHNATVHLLHDGDYLYVGIESGFETSGWNSHSRIRVDGDRDGRLAGSSSLPHTDVLLGQPAPSGWSGYTEYALLGTNEGVTPPSGLERGSSDDPSTYEYRIPLEALGAATGDTSGALLKIHSAADGRRHGYYWPFRPAQPGVTPEDWVGVRLGTANVTAAFTAKPDSPVVGRPITFDASNSTSAVGEITAYAWDFGSDGKTDATGQQLVRAFTEPGTYSVTLRITTESGQVATVTRRITVADASRLSAPFNETFDTNATNWVINDSDARVTVHDTPRGGWTATNRGSVRLVANETTGTTTLSRPLANLERGDRVTVGYRTTSDGQNGTLTLDLITPDGERLRIDQEEYAPTAGNQTHTLTGLLPEDLPDGTTVVVTQATLNATTTSYVTYVDVREGVVPPEPKFKITPAPVQVNETVTLNASSSVDLDGSLSNASFAWDFGNDGTIDARGIETIRTFDTVGGRLIRLTITDSDGLTTNLTKHFTVIPESTNRLVFADDFEDESVGSYPGGWTQNGNSDQKVVSVPNASGKRAFQLKGDAGACWEAISNHPMEVPTNGSVVISAKVRATADGAEGCHRNNVDLNLRTGATHWSAGKRAHLISFDNSGTITSPQGELGTYQRYRWITLRLVYERANDLVRLTYHKDGTVLGSTTRQVSSFEDALQYFSISSGDFTVYYDDIVVAANTTSPLRSQNQQPEASFSANTTQPVTGVPVQFDANASSDVDGNVTHYAWDLNGDGQVDETGETITHTFTTTGSQTVRLSVADDDFGTDSTNKSLTVRLAESIVPFTNTTALTTSQTEPASLANDIQVESEFQSSTTATRLSNSSRNTTISFENGAAMENVTFYVHRSALPTATSLDEVVMFVNGRSHPFYVDRTVGAENDTWVAFTLADVNDTTVTFTSDTAPRATATLLTETNYAGSPARLRITASDPDAPLQAVSYRLPDGTSVSVLSGVNSKVDLRTNITLSQSTWNVSENAYETRNITVILRDTEGESTVTTVPVTVYIPGDASGNGVVDIYDAVVLGRHWKTTKSQSRFVSAADMNHDGEVDIRDAVRMGRSWGRNATSQP